MWAIFGFAFFAMLPLANNCLDYLVRVNIPEQLLGRAWGFIGFISQLGYVVAYGLSGVLADGTAHAFGIGVGRGAAIVTIASGFALIVVSIGIMAFKSIRDLEQD